jgi:solute carrier family 25 carnitine/acylcarnitine transporter 20/29
MSSFKIVGDGSTLEESIASFVCGMLFGATTVIVGHPLDTIKTKLQADSRYQSMTTYRAALMIAREGGIPGFYRGFIPPLVGSTFFRSIQFASYGATVTYCKDEDHILRMLKIGGIEARVFVGGAIAGLSRALIESPLDLIKTRKQTDPTGKLRELHPRDLLKGFSATLTRNVLLLGTFFVFLDRLQHLGTMSRGAVATTAAWTMVWPLDVAKSRMQSAETAKNSISLRQSLSKAARDGTLYRGYTAGITRSMVANSASLKAYQIGQDIRSKYFNRRTEPIRTLSAAETR